ncbi:TetR/AcrR family transcriptional regulator [Deinococcus roseus]|nr:TetR/AcrR family transcriptional regulator [Deinococcus roseus]
MTRVQQKKQDKQERIARAAWDLFTQHGYEKVTTRQVAEQADIATGTLFLYAASKGDLLVLAFEQALRDATQPPEKLPDSIQDTVRLLFSGPLHLYGQHRQLARHFLLEVLRGGSRSVTESNIEQFAQTLTHLLQQASEKGQLKADLDARQAARNFFGIYMMVLLEWLPSVQDVEDARQKLDAAFGLQWSGLEAK